MSFLQLFIAQAPPPDPQSFLQRLYGALAGVFEGLVIIALLAAFLWAANWFLMRRHREMGEEQQFFRRIVMLVLTVIAIMVVLLLVPVPNGQRGQLVALVGLIVTGAIGLASTTFVAHAMAGLMLRAVRSFRPGDFVRVDEHFGRVTGRGLFHTEIQTEDRDLITLPNLYLVSNPIRVVRHSGTIVAASVSLGYDLPHQQIRSLLEQAASEAGLTEPFVQIRDLGDFSVTYRVAGFLPEVKQLLSARAKLRMLMLDTLHGADIEIVSPTVMNQRRLEAGDRILPPKSPGKDLPVDASPDPVPEDLIFDKAEEAARIEGLRIRRDELAVEITDLEARLKGTDPTTRTQLEAEIESRRTQSADAARQLEPSAPTPSAGASADSVPEELVFDKAEEAARIEQLRVQRDELAREIADLEAHLKNADDASRAHLEGEIESRRTQSAEVVRRLELEDK